ncbi:DUF5995 family protein [Nocardia jinanensis]|nr:DUF5995 family protein [Nocardia jinanensis]
MTSRCRGWAGYPVILLATLLAAVSFSVIAPPRAAASDLDTACGTPLSAAELAEIVELSDTSPLSDEKSGSSLGRLERAVARHGRITEILVEHRDRRGLLALGLDAVERAAVMPLQRDPAIFDDPEWAHRISLDLLLRFLRNVHAEFTGTPTEPQWNHYFRLAHRCELSAARVAMAGYNAHLSIDLSNAVAATHASTSNAPDHFRIVDAIASHGSLIVDLTKEIYGGDLGPLWRFYFFGEGLDAVLGAGVATGPLLRLADLGANVVIFGNGLALQDPAAEPAVRAEMDVLWRSADTAFEVLAAHGAL